MTRLRVAAGLFALLMLLATAAFVIGASVERNDEHTGTGAEEAHTQEQGQGEAQGHAEGDEPESAAEGDTEDSDAHAEESETLAGIDTESTSLIVLGAVLSMAIAWLVLQRPRRETYAVATLFCLGFAALDGRELAHQIDENSASVAVFAVLALLLHLGASSVAGSQLLPPKRVS